MAKTISVKLCHPFPGHGGSVTEVVLREPTAEEFFELGEPRTTIFAADPTTTHLKTASQTVEMKQVDNGPAIKKYLEKCVKSPDALLLFTSLSLADAMQVKESLLSFFDLALAAASATPATSSSSTSNSAE